MSKQHSIAVKAGDRVRISLLPTYKVVTNYEIEISGLWATVVHVGAIGFELRFDEPIEDLEDCDNCGTWTPEEVFHGLVDWSDLSDDTISAMMTGYLLGMICQIESYPHPLMTFPVTTP